MVYGSNEMWRCLKARDHFNIIIKLMNFVQTYIKCWALRAGSGRIYGKSHSQPEGWAADPDFPNPFGFCPMGLDAHSWRGRGGLGGALVLTP